MRKLSALFVALTGGCGCYETSSVAVGEAAPSFALKNLANGDVVKTESLRGEVVVITFWSTTCTNCIREIDHLNSIHASGRAEVVGIALDEDRDRVLSLVKKKGIQYQVLMGGQDTFTRFDGYTIPYTVVLDGHRTIRKKFYGHMTEEQFEEVLSAIQGSNQVAMRSRTSVL